MAAAQACAAAGFALVPIAEFDPDAHLSPPVVHIKGFGSRMLLPGAPAPPYPLNMRAQAELERERKASSKHFAALLDAIVATKPGTIVWDGDIAGADSFTALVPALLRVLGPANVHLVSFSFDENLEEKLSAWASALPVLAAHRKLVLVPPFESSADAAALSPSRPGDAKYVHLGRVALQATGSELVFFLGGSSVSANEAQHALAKERPPRMVVAPIRRWKNAMVADPQQQQQQQQQPRDLEWEETMMIEVEGLEMVR